jgi:hypothetical protein
MALPKTSGMLNGIKAQNIVWKPSTWWINDILSRVLGFPSGLETRSTNFEHLPHADTLQDEHSITEQVARSDRQCPHMAVSDNSVAALIVQEDLAVTAATSQASLSRLTILQTSRSTRADTRCTSAELRHNTLCTQSGPLLACFAKSC